MEIVTTARGCKNCVWMATRILGSRQKTTLCGGNTREGHSSYGYLSVRADVHAGKRLCGWVSVRAIVRSPSATTRNTDIRQGVNYWLGVFWDGDSGASPTYLGKNGTRLFTACISLNPRKNSCLQFYFYLIAMFKHFSVPYGPTCINVFEVFLFIHATFIAVGSLTVFLKISVADTERIHIYINFGRVKMIVYHFCYKY